MGSFKVLLANVNTCITPYPVYPLGISHLAPVLTSAGFTVRLYDINVDGEIEPVIAEFAPDMVGLSLRNIDDVQIENTVFFAPFLSEMTKRVKAVTAAPVVLGGSGFSLFPERLLVDSGAEFGIFGEGEDAITALARALQGGESPNAIPGLVFRENGKISTNTRKMVDPATIATPLRDPHLIPFYLDHSAMLNIQTQRGCAFKCCYCTYPVIEGTAFRRRPAAAVVEDFVQAQACGAKYLFVVDSVFNTSKKHVTEICEAIIERGVKIEWGCFLRPQNISVDTMKLMKKAGLAHIEFGSDSFCDETLAAYGKGFTFEDLFEASEAAREAGVHYAHFLISGGPAETEETLRIGFENSKRLKKTVVFPFVGMRLYPGTALYDWALKEGSVPPDTDFLKPYFYVTPHVKSDRILETLRGFGKESSRWVVGEMPPEMSAVMDGLRKRGIVGPMWEYLAR